MNYLPRIRTLVMALCILFVVGCGSDGVTVRQHTITPEEMESSFGPTAIGYSVWDDQSCDIFVFSESEYNRIGAPYLYHETLGHELRHCFEGHWHE